eukprot:2468867-Prymnesium_polylepis.1
MDVAMLNYILNLREHSDEVSSVNSYVQGILRGCRAVLREPVLLQRAQREGWGEALEAYIRSFEQLGQPQPSYVLELAHNNNIDILRRWLERQGASMALQVAPGVNVAQLLNVNAAEEEEEEQEEAELEVDDQSDSSSDEEMEDAMEDEDNPADGATDSETESAASEDPPDNRPTNRPPRSLLSQRERDEVTQQRRADQQRRRAEQEAAAEAEARRQEQQRVAQRAQRDARFAARNDPLIADFVA